MKRAVWGFIIVIALLGLLLAILPAVINANQFRPRIEAELSSALGRQVTVGDLSFSLYSGSVTALNLAVADDTKFSNGPFVRAKSLALGVEMWPLLTTRKLNVTDLTITEPEFNLIQSADGQWNFSTMGAKKAALSPSRIMLPVSTEAPPTSGSEAMNLSVKLITVTKGRLTMAVMGVGRKPTILENLNLSVKDFAADSKFPFSLTAKLGKGDVKFDGTAGPVNQSDASQTPVLLNLHIASVDLNDAGITESSGISGLLSINGAASLQGTTLDWKGVVSIDQAKFVPKGTPAKQPVQFDFSVKHDLRAHSGALTQGDIHLGSAPASLTGTYSETGTVTSVNMHLKGTAMPVSALEGMLPSLDIQLPSGSRLDGGTAAVDVTINGPAPDPVVAGTVELGGTTLTGFDLGSKVSTIERIAGIQPAKNTAIQTVSAGFHSDTGGTTVRDLKFVAPAIGELNGAGTISPQHALDFKMLMNVHAANALTGGGAIPFFVKGTSADPQFQPDVAGIAASQIQRFTNGKKIGGVDAGQVLNNLFGGGKKK